MTGDLLSEPGSPPVIPEGCGCTWRLVRADPATWRLIKADPACKVHGNSGDEEGPGS